MMKQYYSKTILLLILSLLISVKSFSGTSENKISKTLTVIVDPGHGGKDPGAVNKGIREKDVVLGIGLKLGKYMNENFPDVKVIFTRNTDVFVPLIDRSRIANKNKADLFISIHANFCGTPSTKGTETFLLGEARTGDNLDVAMKENSVIQLEDNYKITYEGFDPNSSESYIMFTTIQGDYLKQSLSFARDIQQQFQSRINSSNRGPKQAGFLVLRMSAMPSVLIETGFISNPSEANYLKSEEGQQNIAMSIIDAFRKFKAKNLGTDASVLAETKSEPVKHHTAASTKSDTLVKKGSLEEKKGANPDDDSIADVDKPVVKQEKNPVVKTERKKEDNKLVTENPTTIPEKAKSQKIKSITESISTNSSSENGTYFSVQIGANTTPVETSASNFKGLKDVRREKSDKYYRYYVGKEPSLENIVPILQKIKLKFSQAFIVSFVDGKRIIIDAGSK